MEGNVRLAERDLTRLKCDLCHGYLSVPPISSYRDKNACGRCNPEWERNVIYEQLAKYMAFPCVYCEKSYPWDMVQNHEKKCKGNIILCPVNQKNLYKTGKNRQGEFHKECQRVIRCPFELCMVSFDLQKIIEHFSKYHKDYIFTNSVEANKIFKVEKVWNFSSDTQVCVILFNTIPFLLFVHNDCEFNDQTGDILYYNYYFTVFTFCLEGCNNINYTASLQCSLNDGISTTTKRTNQQIQIFNDKVHCVSFLRRDLFKLNSFDFMATKFSKIERFEHLVLRYNIKIVDNLQLIPSQNKDANMFDMLGIEKQFECPICKEYMSPPIYNCNTGHSICRICKEKLSLCPYCQAVIGYSRNFVLEDILETLLLHCHNERKGCDFTGTVKDIKLHEVICNYN